MTSTPSLSERLPWRCDVTGNPVGTDTQRVGYQCMCQGCRAAAEIARLQAEAVGLVMALQTVAGQCKFGGPRDTYNIAVEALSEWNLGASLPAPATAEGEIALAHGRNCPALGGSFPGIADDCTCGLIYRQQLQTEQTMHAAWRKRAEEAEAELASLRSSPATGEG